MMMMSDKEDANADDQSERRKRSRQIGSKLRQIYDEVAQEEVPDEFLRILEEADQAQSDK